MDDQVAQFIGITNATESTAAFYLESCGGSVEAAVQSFFDSGGAEVGADTAQVVPSSAAAPAPATGGSSVLADAAAARAARLAAAGGAGPSSSRPAGTSRGGRSVGANVRGLGDIGNGDEDDEDEDDDHNDYYVGGEKSGQVVRGAPKDKKEGGQRRPGEHVDDIFEGAKAAGAEQATYADLEDEYEEGGAGGRFRAFRGTARTLAGGEVAPPQQAAGGGGGGPERRIVKIVFYGNGVFTVDDAEPRSMSDPSNRPFMEAIMRGQLPAELDPGDPSIQVHVNLLRRDEDYTPPAQPRVRAFTGTGYKLTADDAGGAGPSTAAGPTTEVTPGAVTWEGADPAQPTTSIQLRLADGSRLRAEFNLSHTVADIRRFIRASRPDTAGRAYRLATAFPAQQLDDDSVTIEAAGLANSVVVQKN